MIIICYTKLIIYIVNEFIKGVGIVWEPFSGKLEKKGLNQDKKTLLDYKLCVCPTFFSVQILVFKSKSR